MSSDDEGGSFSTQEDFYESEQEDQQEIEYPTEPGDGDDIFSEIPRVRYGELLERRSLKRSREPTPLPPAKRKKTKKTRNPSPPKTVRFTEPAEEEEEEGDEPEDEMTGFLAKKEATAQEMRGQLWMGYVKICEAADTMIGEPSSFPEIIAGDKDLRSCFDSCLDSGSFGDAVKNIDPLHLLLFSTFTTMYMCKRGLPNSQRQDTRIAQAPGAPEPVIPMNNPPPQRAAEKGGTAFNYEGLFGN